MKRFALAYLVLGLTVSGCGEQLSSETKMAIEQIEGEASKAAVRAIDEIKSDALVRLKNVHGVPEKSDQSQDTTASDEKAVVQKYFWLRATKSASLLPMISLLSQ